MARDSVLINKWDGISTFISKEDRPVEVMQTLVNLRHGEKFGRAVKRGGYSSLLSAGLTTLKRMIEFKDKNTAINLMLMDGNALEASVYSGGTYGAIAAVSGGAKDERTASASIVGNDFNPVIINKEMRAGAGTNASTDYPMWYGHIASRNRFADNETLTAGLYLIDQYEPRTTLLPVSAFDIQGADNQVSGTGFSADAKFQLWAAPIYDGYQKGMPFLADTGNFSLYSISTGQSSAEVNITIATANAAKDRRVTGFDLFVATLNQAIDGDYSVTPAYFLKRVDMNDEEVYYSILGNVGNTTANKIVIAGYADWMSFDPRGMFMRAGGADYRVTAYALDTPGAGEVEFTVTPNAADLGASDVTIQFVSKWYDNGGGYYAYETFYDNVLHKLGSEMYAYLNIPSGDTGITDFRYKYAAYNGNRALYTGFPTDTNFSYYSANEAPDVVPSLNIFRHKYDTKGAVNVGRDFFVFTERGIERISIYGNQQTEQDDEFSNSILAHTKSIVKVSDEVIAFMSYDGPKLLAGRKEIAIGEQLLEWWNTTLTQAQKEACVAGYNFLHDELYFSFPTYTTSPYSNGIIFVFDLKAWRNEYISPWWIWSCDTPIYAFEGPNSVQHLLAGGLTKVLDFDGGGSESFSTSYKIKMLQNIVPNKKVWWDRVFADVTTSDTVTANLYFDGSSTAVALSLNSDLNGFIRYMKETLELELSTSASTNTVEHKGCLLSFTPRSK